jgi:hypothetical protein
MSAWIEMAASRDELVMQLFWLAVMVLAAWQLALADHPKARIVAYGVLCIGFFATLTMGWLLR